MHSRPNRMISGHVRLRQGKRTSTWYAKYRGPVRLADGSIVTKQTEVKIGAAWTGRGRPPDGAYTRKTAEAWLDALLVDLRRGIGIPSADAASTFADAASAWYRAGCTVQAWKPATRRDYRSALSAHLGVDLDPVSGEVVEARAPFGDLRLEEVTTHAIEAWRTSQMTPYKDEDGVERVKLTRRMAVKCVAVMHGILAAAAQPPFNLASNAAAGVKPLRERYDAGRFDFYSVEELHALVRAAADEEEPEKRTRGERDSAIYLTAALTGMRLGEVLALRVRDVDFDGRHDQSPAVRRSDRGHRFAEEWEGPLGADGSAGLYRSRAGPPARGVRRRRRPCLPERRRAGGSTGPPYAADTRPPRSARSCGRSGSTTSATRSVRTVGRPRRATASCRSGWATPTRGRLPATPTTDHGRTQRTGSRRRSSREALRTAAWPTQPRPPRSRLIYAEPRASRAIRSRLGRLPRSEAEDAGRSRLREIGTERSSSLQDQRLDAA